MHQAAWRDLAYAREELVKKLYEPSLQHSHDI
jgi:hypothetical protein